jgi:hypothetical protein
MSAGLIFVDIHLMYQNLSQGRPVTLPEVGGYRDYTARQREKIASMTLSSPEIRDWIDSPRTPAATGRAFRWSWATRGPTTRATSSPSSC